MKKLTGKMIAAAISLTLAFTAAAAPVSAAWSKNAAGHWSFSTANGKATGWLKDGGRWYYLGNDGVMRTGWQKIDNVWYYLGGSDSGVMRTGWASIDGKWYFFSASGAMKTGWASIGGKWYYMDASGVMRTGWLQQGDSWYRLGSDGAMAVGWTVIDEKTYYFDNNGVMATGSTTIGGVTYPFDKNGVYTGSQAPGETMADQVLAQVNSVRAKEGLNTLKVSKALNAAAAQRARERAMMGTLAHYRPDGSHWWTILEEYGISNLDGSAENLACGVDTPDAAMKAWMESSSHKSAILGDSYRYMGVGRYTRNGVTYWAQIFSGSETAK